MWLICLHIGAQNITHDMEKSKDQNSNGRLNILTQIAMESKLSFLASNNGFQGFKKIEQEFHLHSFFRILDAHI